MNETKPSPPDWLINDIAEASRNARRAYLFYIGFLSYCVLTVVSTTDRQLILKNEVVHLPIINIDVLLSGFFIIAPLIAILVFVYFQLYLSRLDNLTTELRESYAPTEKGRLSQWMINIAEGSEPGAIGKLEAIIVKFALWWPLPIALILFAVWFIKKHSPILSYIVGVLYLIAGTVIVLLFWCGYEKIKLKDFIRDPWKITLASFVLIIQIFLVFLIVAKNEGIWLSVTRYWISVDLSYQKLVTEPQPDYNGIYWADLKGVHLEGANLTSSVLKRADLQNAQMQLATLYSSILEGANLRRANLQGAFLVGANLQGADLGGANLQGANLGRANLQGANLRRANLKGADLFYSNLERANLTGADLEGADLWGADLRGTLHLTIEQLSKVKTLYQAELDSSVMEQVQKNSPHLLEEPKVGK